MQINIENLEHLVLEHNRSITMAALLLISGIDVLFVGELKEVLMQRMKRDGGNITVCHPDVTISDAVSANTLCKKTLFQIKISKMAGTIVVPGSRLCVADNQHCAGPGTYM